MPGDRSRYCTCRCDNEADIGKFRMSGQMGGINGDYRIETHVVKMLYVFCRVVSCSLCVGDLSIGYDLKL